MKKFASLLALSSLFAIACGDGDARPRPGDHNNPSPRQGEPNEEEVQAACAGGPGIELVGLQSGETIRGWDGDIVTNSVESIMLSASFGFRTEAQEDELDPGDRVFIEARNGMGRFPGGIEPGSFNLTQSGTNYDECGLCVYAQLRGKTLMATSGAVTLSEAAQYDRISGAMADVVFQQVDDEYNIDPAGCQLRLSRFVFDLPVPEGIPGF